MRDPDKPQQIIDAAIRVFARNGYYNSRVSDIAREAGIASGTIYLYFKTKDEILVTLFREKMAESGAIIPPLGPDHFAKFIHDESVRWQKVVKDANIKVE